MLNHFFCMFALTLDVHRATIVAIMKINEAKKGKIKREKRADMRRPLGNKYRPFSQTDYTCHVVS